MSKANFEVKVSTDADVFQVAVDGKPLEFKNGLARALIEKGTEYILSWWIMGSPGTTYEIDVRAEQARIKGLLPVKGRIGQGRMKAGGTRMFSVLQG